MTALNTISDDALKALYQQSQAPANPLASMSDAELTALHQKTDKPSGPDQTSWYGRLGTGAMDAVAGLGQLASRLGPGEATPVGQDANEIARQGSSAMDSLIAQREKDYQASRGQNAGTFDPMRVAGGALATTPIAMLVPGGAAATIPRLMANGAAVGGLTAATQPVTEGDFTSEKLKQIGTGAALGGAASGVSGGAARIISPEVSPAVRTLMDEGVTPTPGQLGGKAGRTLEKMTEHVPLVGNMPISAEQRTLGEFNLATVNQALRPLGQKLPEGVKPGNEAIDAAKNIISNAFDDAYSRLSVRATPEFVQEVGAIGAEVPENFSKEFGKRVAAQFGNIKPDGEIAGRTLADARKYFQDLATKYGRDPGAEQQLLGNAFGKVSDAIDNMVTTAHPGEKALDAAKQAWAMFIRTRGAAAKDAMAGVFSPAQLAQTVRQYGGEDAFSRGTALMQPWTQAALKVMGPNAPRSQSVTSNMIGGAGALYALPHLMNPGAALPALGVASMYSPIGQRLTALAMTKRPEYAKALADALRSGAPYVANNLGATQ